RGLIVFWTSMFGMTAVSGMILAALGPPKPLREVANRISPARVPEPSKQPVDHLQAANSSVQRVNSLANPTTRKPPAVVRADQVPVAELTKATMAPTASDPAIGRT